MIVNPFFETCGKKFACPADQGMEGQKFIFAQKTGLSECH